MGEGPLEGPENKRVALSSNLTTSFFNLNGRYYVGQTDDLDGRVGKHDRGEVMSTRPFRPWKLVYTEVFKKRAEAVRREREIKSRKKRAYIDRLIRGVAQPG